MPPIPRARCSCRWSKGAQRALLLAAEHPERVLGAVFIGPALGLSPVAPERAQAFRSFRQRLDSDEGWEKWNAEYWRDDLPGFLEFFLGEMFCEPHSTKQIEDGIAWGLETDPETLIATMLAPAPSTREQALELCSRVSCPVLVIHGDGDEMRPLEVGRQLAAATGGEFVPLAGHRPRSAPAQARAREQRSCASSSSVPRAHRRPPRPDSPPPT